MAITKVTSKSKELQSIAVAPAVKAKSQTTLMVEELIVIHKTLTEAGAFEMVKRLDELKKGLQQVMKDSGADEEKPYVFSTQAGSVEFGPCANTTEVIDKVMMIKMLGMDTFKEIAKVGTTDLKTYLSATEIESFTAKGKGSRSLKSVKVAE